jgi:ligand-binding SRPBCC domain-containing protein
MVQRFENHQWVPFPVELVFAFLANPSNLPHLMPPARKARIEDLRIQPPPPRPVAVEPSRRFRSVSAGMGSEILLSFCPVRWIPQRMSWLATIVEFEWNSHFVDEQVRGPFKTFRHRHVVRAEERENVEGTAVVDEIEYELPGGPAGRLAKGIVRAQMKKVFGFRRQRLPEILAATARQAVRRS